MMTPKVASWFCAALRNSSTESNIRITAPSANSTATIQKKNNRRT